MNNIINKVCYFTENRNLVKVIQIMRGSQSDLRYIAEHDRIKNSYTIEFIFSCAYSSSWMLLTEKEIKNRFIPIE